MGSSIQKFHLLDKVVPSLQGAFLYVLHRVRVEIADIQKHFLFHAHELGDWKALLGLEHNVRSQVEQDLIVAEVGELRQNNKGGFSEFVEEADAALSDEEDLMELFFICN